MPILQRKPQRQHRYRDRQGRLVLDDIHDLPEVVEKVFAGHPEFTHTLFHEGN